MVCSFKFISQTINVLHDLLIIIYENSKDLKQWAIKNKDGNYEIRWFVAKKEVRRSFYLIALG